MRRWLRSTIPLVLVLTASPACVEGVGAHGDDGTIACDASARGSVSLTIVDAETGEPVPAAIVRFQVDGGEVRQAGMLDYEGRVTLAYEEAGHFEVTIEAEGYEPASAEYEVAQGQCHVEGVGDTIELVPLPAGG
jgi:hypothetical protein